jgi:hypothetical protein
VPPEPGTWWRPSRISFLWFSEIPEVLHRGTLAYVQVSLSRHGISAFKTYYVLGTEKQDTSLPLPE